MSISEIKKWSKEKLKGNLWVVFPALFIAGVLTNFSISTVGMDSEGNMTGYAMSFGWVFYFVEVGFTLFMVKFITDKKPEFKDLFAFARDIGKHIAFCLIQAVFVFLWSLLFIIPGIIKLFAYSLVPMLLADDKYKDKGYMEILKLSEEMMRGNKAKLFSLYLSFIGWHLLAACTCFILEIWVGPYQEIAKTKFLYDVKEEYEKKNGKK